MTGAKRRRRHMLVTLDANVVIAIDKLIVYGYPSMIMEFRSLSDNLPRERLWGRLRAGHD